MSFNVNLFSNFSKAKNSTKVPSGGSTLPCDMVEPCGVLSPRISFNQGTQWNPSSYNYAQIPDFSRYYWVNEWTWDSGRWYASLSVDPMASWKTSILASTEYVTRSASSSDSHIVDTMYPTKEQYSFNANAFQPWTGRTLTSGSYVVGVLGANETATGGVGYFVASSSGLNNLIWAMMRDTNWIGSVPDISDELLRCLVNPMQYITSVMWLPIAPDGGSEVSSVHAGWWYTGIGLAVYQGANVIEGTAGTRTSHPQSSGKPWLNYAPFTTITLEVPPFGKINLNPEKYPVGSDVNYRIVVDGISGMGYVRTFPAANEAAGEIMFAKVGVDLSVGQSTASGLGAAGGTISQAAGIAGFASGLMNRNPLAAIGSAIEGMRPELNTICQNGGTAMYIASGHLVEKFVMIVDTDNEHLGTPLCRKVKLSSLSGYAQCLDPDVDIPCASQEHDQIAAYMSNGFYIE